MTTQTELAKQAAKGKGKGKGPKTPRGPKETEPGDSALQRGLGRDALAGGEEMANKYIPPAQQLAAAPSAGQVGAANQLTGNIASNVNVNQGLADQQQNAQRSGAQQDVLNRQNDIAQNGLGAQEYQGLREQMQNGLNSSLNTNMAQLAKAQARGKVYGAAASAQSGNLLNAADNTRANNEQQLMLKSGDIRRQGLTDYSNTLNSQDSALAANANAYSNAAQNAQGAETARGTAAAGQENINAANTLDQNKFNIGENDATTAARLGTITNTAGLINAQKTTNIQEGLGADAIQGAGGSLTNYNKAMGQNKANSRADNRADTRLAKGVAKNNRGR